MEADQSLIPSVPFTTRKEISVIPGEHHQVIHERRRKLIPTATLDRWTRNAVHEPAIQAFLAGKHAEVQAKMTLAEQIERIEGAITADEVAKLLGVSKITVFKMAKRGRIPSFRIWDLRAV